MRSRLSFFICLMAAAMLVAACSSTTVVARDERATTSSATAADDSSDEPEAEPAGDNSDTDSSDQDDDQDEDNDGRGERDETSTSRDAAEGFGLGGAEQITSLLVDCQDGNDLACDILFQISSFDSDEELAAATCGGRSDVEVSFCTSGIDAGADQLVFDPDSGGLERVVEACEVDGNMTACDFLYYRSPIGSEFQEIGGTCGGRVNVAVPDCRSIIEE